MSDEPINLEQRRMDRDIATKPLRQRLAAMPTSLISSTTRTIRLMKNGFGKSCRLLEAKGKIRATDGQ